VSRRNTTDWIPAFAGMTKPVQAAGNKTIEIKGRMLKRKRPYVS
jgi:hypothetical protein